MLMSLQILNQLKNEGSTKKKLEILKENRDNQLLREVFRLAYNKRYSFYMKKLPEVNYVAYIPQPSLTLGEFLIRLEHDIAARVYTGHAAQKHVGELLGRLSPDDLEVARRVILRDLECGASGSSANKVWPKLIPEQPCMTASSYSEKALSNIVYPAYAQLKADGTRCMIIKHNGEVSAWSRNGKQFVGITPILRAVEESEVDNFVLDGELVYKPKKVESGLDFLFGEDEKEEVDVANRQTGNGIVMKSQEGGTITPEEADCIHFQCWDVVSRVEDYWEGKHDVAYKKRLEMATKVVVEYINDPHLEMIETTVVHNLKEAREVYIKYVEMGLEGIILKNVAGIWEFKRSKNQVKFKETIDIDMIITGVYAHKKDPSKVGGFNISTKCGRIQCDVGSGFTDTTHIKSTVDGEVEWVYIPLSERGALDREYLMSISNQLVDLVCECQCNGYVTRRNRKQDEAEFRLFLPIIKGIRFDKSPEQANTFEEIFG